MINWSLLQVEPKGEFVPKPLHMLDKREVQLKRRTIVQLKVKCKHFEANEDTWENESTMREAYPTLFHDFIPNPWNTRDGVVLSREGCNILNFDLTLMVISPIDYDVTLMFSWNIGSKTPLHMNMMIFLIYWV